MGIREGIKKAWEYIKGIGVMLEPDDKDYVAEAHVAGLTASEVKTLLNADSDTVKLAASTFGDGKRRRKAKEPLDFDGKEPYTEDATVLQSITHRSDINAGRDRED